MASPGKTIRYWVVLVGMLVVSGVSAQHIWSDVQFNRRNVFVGQPMEVTVKVYTSTWFTTGVSAGNVKVEGAFTVFFRSLSSSIQLDGKTYAGVELTFNVFPFDDESVVFPALEIPIESPEEGGYKGVKRIVKTQERVIPVKPIPPGFDPEQWLVTTSLSVRENWSRDLNNIKVGDVLERRIERSAGNTVSELIPPVKWDTLQFVSLYPGRSRVENNKTKTSISASRVETMRYLFEREGEVVLPEQVFTWWNPSRQELYKRTLPKVRITILPNPDLGMLASIQDSLLAEVNEEVGEEEKEDISFLGLSLWQWIVIGTLSIFVLMFCVKLGRRYAAIRASNIAAYRQSEEYYFKQFKHAVRQGQTRQIVQTMYRWIDSLDLHEPTVSSFIEHFGTDQLKQRHATVQPQQEDSWKSVNIQLREWERARANYLRQDEVASSWINP